MTQEQRNKLAELILECAIYYGKLDLPEANISAFINILIKHFNAPFEQFVKAFRDYMKDPKNKNFPSPSVLRPYILPELDEDMTAVAAAARAIEAVSKFGWNNPGAARSYVGELGWRAVSRFGGWQYVCENLGSEISITTFQAQMREIAKTEIKMAKNGFSGPIELPYQEKTSDMILSDKKNQEVSKLIDFMKKETTLEDQ